MTAISVVSIGECMIELSRAADGRCDMGYAGDTFNTLWALRALLPKASVTDYVTAFGDDPFSVSQRTFFVDHGIGSAASPTLAGTNPGLYAITLDGYERSFTYWRSAAAARSLADDRAKLVESLRDRDLIYFSGITLAILSDAARETLLSEIKEVRAAGALIAFDPNYRPRLWPDVAIARSVISEALTTVDIALPTFDDEQSLYGDASAAETVSRLQEAGVKEIVVKCGASEALYAAGTELGGVKPRKVAAPVDTSGAGDAFNGGYLAARLDGLTVAAAVARAHETAASAIQTRGALIKP